jgi:predicted DNA repair protein MutK
VAAIVKLDDAGLYLNLKTGGGLASLQRAIGRALLWAAPLLMKSLSVIGTAAMFMVGGGILAHGIPGVEAWMHAAAVAVHAVPGIGGALEMLTPTVLGALLGVVAGALVLLVVNGMRKLLRAGR